MENAKIPQQFEAQYAPQYIQQLYPQQPPLYQQPMVLPNPLPPGYVAPVQDIFIGAGAGGGGRQQAGILRKGGLQRLDEQTGIFVQQKFELAELVLCCETQNRYNVYALNSDGKKQGRQMFKAKEKSGCCSRICLSGDCRPFKMSVSTAIRGEEENEYEPFLHIERPCKWTCLCFNRPYLQVTLVEGGRSEYIGKIVDPFNWCHLEMNIFDKDNNHKYTILGNCCQLGILCQCPCEPCQTVDFEVRTASGELVSHLQKRTPGCLQAWATDMDNFALVFPKNCTPEDKALLMSAVLFIDYRHFETNPRNDN